MEQKTSWWKYEPSTLKHVRLTLGWMFLAAGCVHVVRYFSGAAPQSAGMLAIMYLCGSAAMLWLAFRIKD